MKSQQQASSHHSREISFLWNIFSSFPLAFKGSVRWNERNLWPKTVRSLQFVIFLPLANGLNKTRKFSGDKRRSGDVKPNWTGSFARRLNHDLDLGILINLRKTLRTDLKSFDLHPRIIRSNCHFPEEWFSSDSNSPAIYAHKIACLQRSRDISAHANRPT